MKNKIKQKEKNNLKALAFALGVFASVLLVGILIFAVNTEKLSGEGSGAGEGIGEGIGSGVKTGEGEGENKIVEPAFIGKKEAKIVGSVPSGEGDPFILKSVEVLRDERALKATFVVSGGCAEHDFEMYSTVRDEFVSGDYPFGTEVQRFAEIYFRHDDNDDACDGVMEITKSFDLSEIVRLYEERHGNEEKLFLRVYDFGGNSFFDYRYYPLLLN